jgi:hypothetical protein
MRAFAAKDITDFSHKAIVCLKLLIFYLETSIHRNQIVLAETLAMKQYFN